MYYLTSGRKRPQFSHSPSNKGCEENPRSKALIFKLGLLKSVRSASEKLESNWDDTCVALTPINSNFEKQPPTTAVGSMRFPEQKREKQNLRLAIWKRTTKKLLTAAWQYDSETNADFVVLPIFQPWSKKSRETESSAPHFSAIK